VEEIFEASNFKKSGATIMQPSLWQISCGTWFDPGTHECACRTIDLSKALLLVESKPYNL
jgi:hypothetical protein